VIFIDTRMCRCGHLGIEHYDGHGICTFTVSEGAPWCDCERFEVSLQEKEEEEPT
jgi:hypothetical protein